MECQWKLHQGSVTHIYGKYIDFLRFPAFIVVVLIPGLKVIGFERMLHTHHDKTVPMGFSAHFSQFQANVWCLSHSYYKLMFALCNIQGHDRENNNIWCLSWQTTFGMQMKTIPTTYSKHLFHLLTLIHMMTVFPLPLSLSLSHCLSRWRAMKSKVMDWKICHV